MSDFAESPYHLIFVGGGTVALVIASRLSAADPSLRILVIEAGPPTRDDPAHVQPARYLTHLLPTSKTVRFYESKPSADLDGRSVVVPTGQCLGGGSSVNFAMYTRPAASDFDDWETVYGILETYQAEGSKDTHGDSGPVKVSYGGMFTNIGQQFLEVASQYDKKRSIIDDPNGLFKCDAYGRWQKFISADDGRRSDVPHHYIYNHEFPNLHILTGYLVKYIIFEGLRAVGVEYLPNSAFHPLADSQVLVAHATRLVVVSAGTLGSPGVLERSGIGNGHLLQNLGIQMVADLPGVGETYQDHNVIFPPYFVDDRAETLDGIVRGEETEIEKWTAKWEEDGTGLMAHNGIDAGVKMRPSEEELEVMSPHFQHRWQEYFANAPDKPALWVGVVSGFVGDHSKVPPRKYCSVGYYVEYPMSEGYVHIRSAEDVLAAPDFDPKYLHRTEDLVLLRWGYTHSREIARRMPYYRGEYSPHHPLFPEGSQATCCGEADPVPITAPSIPYTTEDDKAIDEYTRGFVNTAWHSLGTCAMKPRAQGGVVDSRLNVYGVSAIKVADMSIVPSNVSANTYSTALAIGEKAALIIMEDIGVMPLEVSRDFVIMCIH